MTRPTFLHPPPIVNDWSLKSHYKRATCEITTGVFWNAVLDRDIPEGSITRRTNLLITVFGDGLHKIRFHQALCAGGGEFEQLINLIFLLVCWQGVYYQDDSFTNQSKVEFSRNHVFPILCKKSL